MEMAQASKVTFDLEPRKIAYMAEAEDYAKMGLVPAGSYKNRQYTEGKLKADGIGEHYLDLLHDPQTSGGLLFAIPKEEANGFYEALLAADLRTKVSVIGEVVPRDGKLVHLL